MKVFKLHQEVCGTDEPNDTLTDYKSVKSKVKIKRSAPNSGNKNDVKTAVLLNHLSNFWKSLEIALINCESNLILTWPPDCVLSFCNWGNKISNNRYKTLCSNINFINLRQ